MTSYWPSLSPLEIQIGNVSLLVYSNVSTLWDFFFSIFLTCVKYEINYILYSLELTHVILFRMQTSVLIESHLNVVDSWFKMLSIQCVMHQSETC